MILEERKKKIIYKKLYFRYTGNMKDAEQFKTEREEKFGGKIRFLSYARFIGRASTKKVLNRGGLLYVIGDNLYFEDFERTAGVMTMFNHKENYTKTELSFDLGEISMVKKINEKSAISSVRGNTEENQILPVTKGFLGFFVTPVVQIMVHNQTSLFLDIMDNDGFVTLINEYMTTKIP
ncbi:MAG: hypothetical protein JEY91_16990 [Spirochaetaceae bacterium]|nr:hypothetical protein [Spirochaetaceae bacterium]